MNSDVLRLIALRLDSRSLFNFYYTPFWEQILVLLSDNSFWYEKSNRLSNRELPSMPDADWKRIYQAIEAFIDWEDIEFYLDYLPSLRTLVAINGSPRWTENEARSVWTHVASVHVLEYLLESGLLVYDVSEALIALDWTATREGSEALLRYLLSMIHKSLEAEDDEEAASEIVQSIYDTIIHAITDHHFEATTILLDYYSQFGSDYQDLLDMAVGNRDDKMIFYLIRDREMEDLIGRAVLSFDHISLPSSVLGYIIGSGGIVTQLADHLFDVAREEEDIDTLELLITSQSVNLSVISWRRLLTEEIENGRQKNVGWILTHYVPNLDEIASDLKSSSVSIHDPSIVIVLRSQSTLSIPTLKKLWKLKGHSSTESDLVRGYMIAGAIAGGSFSNREELGRELERMDNLHSLLLQFIVLKRPSNSELLDALITIRDPEVREAAIRVLDGRTGVIASLLLCVLYPTLSLQELIVEMREDMSNEEIVLASRLIGAHLGETGLRARG